MRSKTQQIFERLNKGSFLSVDSIDADEKLVMDIIILLVIRKPNKPLSKSYRALPNGLTFWIS